MGKKTVSIIGTAGIPSNYGGFETLAENLVVRLGDRISFIVYCSRAKKPGNMPLEKFRDTRLLSLPLKANGISSIFYDIISMLHSIFASDTLLILGVSGCIALPFIRLLSGRRIITNLDGMEWKRSKWNSLARLFLKFSWKLAMKFSHDLILDNKCLLNNIPEKYRIKSHLIEYGGDTAIQTAKKADKAVYPFLDSWYALSVCRIEPENNIGMILEAFVQLTCFNLVIIGNWENSSWSRELRDKHRDRKNLFLADAVYDQDILYDIRSRAGLYIHGHSAGGTNPSLVEIMFHGICIFAYDVCYNRETTQDSAFYFRDSGSLADLVRNTKKTDMEASAGIMKEIAQRRYRWDTIAGKYCSLIG